MPRADAQRNLDSLLQAAKDVFATSGVDAPVREIATKAGVGVATVYRHFPNRADLVAAVFRREVDGCASLALHLARDFEAFEALKRWLHRYTSLIATKRGLATALHAGDPAREGLAEYFQARLEPTLETLLDAAAEAGQIRDDVEPHELLRAVSNLSTVTSASGAARGRHMVDVLLDGLRFGARTARRKPREVRE